jgi:hypothetical protein
MAITLAFDVYGTLIDTHGIVVALGKHPGNNPGVLSWGYERDGTESR